VRPVPHEEITQRMVGILVRDGVLSEDIDIDDDYDGSALTELRSWELESAAALAAARRSPRQLDDHVDIVEYFAQVRADVAQDLAHAADRAVATVLAPATPGPPLVVAYPCPRRPRDLRPPDEHDVVLGDRVNAPPVRPVIVREAVAV